MIFGSRCNLRGENGYNGLARNFKTLRNPPEPMPRPQTPLTGTKAGPLLIGERLPGSGNHARFRCTCQTCHQTLEVAARYLQSGCRLCSQNQKRLQQAQDLQPDIQAVTYQGPKMVSLSQVWKTLKANPETMFFHEGSRAATFDKGSYIDIYLKSSIRRLSKRLQEN